MSARNSLQTALTGPTTLAAWADPPTRYVDGAAMDYFIIEAVNALEKSSAVAAARAKKIEQEMVEAGLIPPSPPALPSKKDTGRESTDSNLARVVTGKLHISDDDELRVRSRLESIGMHVGANLAERLCHDRIMFAETLDVIKFICKDLWSSCWDKQVDNLRTNHRGVYVLQDNSFKPISRISSHEGRAEAMQRAKVYVAMPAGIIRGALLRLGFQSVVIPEIVNLPQCTFQIKLPKNT